MKNIIITIRIFLQVTPDEVLRKNIIAELIALEGISKIHHIHLWSLDGENHVLTAHLVLTQAFEPLTQMSIKKAISEEKTPDILSEKSKDLFNELFGETQ